MTTQTAWTPTKYRGDRRAVAHAIKCRTCCAREGDHCGATARSIDELLNNGRCPLARWTDDRLHVLTTLFNPVSSQRIWNNYVRFREALPSEIVLHTAEATFGDQQPVVPDSLWVRAGRDHTIWQKERLLNLLWTQLPTNVEFVAWIDADVLFERADWHLAAVESLRAMPVVQLFDVARWLDRDGREETRFWGSAALRLNPRAGHWGHPGFAWAARKSALRSGLFEADPTGGADTFMSDHFCGTPNRSPQSPAMASAYAEWKRATSGAVVGVVPGVLNHLWHGDWKDRRYTARSSWIQKLNWNPYCDAEIDPSSGLWRWTDRNPGLRAAVEAYFPSRKDDG
jgi:hypothetical protein